MSKPLSNCSVLLLGNSYDSTKTNLAERIRELGGTVARTFNKNVKYVMASDVSDDYNEHLVADFTIYSEDWLEEIEKKDAIPADRKALIIAKPTKAAKAAATKAMNGTSAATPAASPTATAASTRSQRNAAVAPTPSPTSSTDPASSTPSPTSTTASKRKRAASPSPAPVADVKKAKVDDSAAADPAVLTTLVIKGSSGIPVDSFIPAALKDYHVYVDKQGLVYDAMLNQANIVANNNKFYVLQVLQHDSDPLRFACWMRWGRVGATGQSKPHMGLTAASATSIFRSKFADKSGNSFDDFTKTTFTPRKGLYIYIQRDYSNDDDKDADKAKKVDDEEEEKKSDEPAKTFPPSVLEPKVQDFVKLICNVETMTRQMLEVGFDARKMPLGKLSKATIKLGYTALSTIADVIQSAQKNKVNLSLRSTKEYQEIVDATNLFYTYIPHCSGMSALPIISTTDLLNSKLAMLESLGEIEAATKILEDKTDYSKNPIDSQYEGLKCDIKHIDLESDVGKMICQYVKNTHGSTHNFKLTVEDLYSVEREGEENRYAESGFDKDTNRQLLWHGSRLTNYMGILSQGLRIAPPEAPATGYMFGKGVYFADMVSKSANYCASYSSNNTGLLLLCEVALGKCNELKQSNYRADLLPAGTLSTKGLGRTVPDDGQAVNILNNVKVPLGSPKPLTAAESKDLCLLYNEYIVYNVSQVRMRYLVKLKFK